MAYGFNSDKSKFDLTIKDFVTYGEFTDGGSNNVVYFDSKSVTPPEGYTPVSVVIDTDGAIHASLRVYNGRCIVELLMKSTGTAQVFQYTAHIYCVRSGLVEE